MTSHILKHFRLGLFGVALLTAGTALAGAEVPVTGKLEVKTPTVEVKSWNGKDRGAIPQQRRFDPMGIKVSGVHPDTRLELFRQGRSKDVELGETVEGPHVLEAAAKRASVWKPVREMKTENAHAGVPAVEVETDPAKVLWPGTRLKITGKTRDGQDLPHVNTVVDGLPMTNEQRYTFGTNTTHQIQLSGAFLPSARAWIHANNLFVSEPVRNEAQLKLGQEKSALAAEKEKLAAATTLEMQEMAKPPHWNETLRPKYNELALAIQTLTKEVATLKAEAVPLIAQGEKVLVNVVSAAAAPGQAVISTTNPRVAGEKPQAQHTVNGATDGDGFVIQSVEALRQDKLKTTVTFPAAANVRVGSLHEVTYEVPHADTKPAFEMGGVRYYRVKPLESRQVNDTPTP